MTILLIASHVAIASTSFVSLQLGGETINLEVAADPRSRYTGLSDRATLADDQGMLFVFPRPVDTAFVMRRCLIPIDIVFTDSDGAILAVHEMQVEPYDTPEHRLTRYPSGSGMRYAIELAGGRAAQLGLSVGDQIELTDQIKSIKSR